MVFYPQSTENIYELNDIFFGVERVEMMKVEMGECYEAIESQTKLIQIAMVEEVIKLGFEQGAVTIYPSENVKYRLDTSLFKGLLNGEWQNSEGEPIGSVSFTPDGGFFAQHDVCQLHPSCSGQLVEAVTVWGAGRKISAGVKLSAMH